MSALAPALVREVREALFEAESALNLAAHPSPFPAQRGRERARALRACDEATRFLALARDALLGGEKIEAGQVDT